MEYVPILKAYVKFSESVIARIEAKQQKKVDLSRSYKRGPQAVRANIEVHAKFINFVLLCLL